ncbi:MAG: hypothetical protein QF607_07100, partial [Nitrospinaceae bacterium]|nr:hypothetical protein [Nitrospinaceae bacterium]
GPIIRVTLLSNSEPFKAAVGASLILLASYLFYEITPGYLALKNRLGKNKGRFEAHVVNEREDARLPSTLPNDIKINTVEKNMRFIRIRFRDEEWKLSVPMMVFSGFMVGIVATTFGVSG